MIFGSCGYLISRNGEGGHQKKIQTHAYYYHQIKAQLQTTKDDYCDFFVMLVNDFCRRNPVETFE